MPEKEFIEMLEEELVPYVSDRFTVPSISMGSPHAFP
jgi:enterochelin esterase-like enzyme